MSRVGEAQDPGAGVSRHGGGFLAGAAALLGFRSFFGRADTFEAAAPVTPCELPRAPAPSEAAAPQLEGDEDRPSQTSEIERLVTHLTGFGAVGRARRILVTPAPNPQSPLAALDCAGFASQLARALAFEGRAILVVIGAGAGPRPGLAELIDGSASFSEAIHREVGSRLHILPAGRGRANPGTGMGVVLDALCDTYDYVVLALGEGDGDTAGRLALALSPRVDHVLIGCSGQTGSPEMVALRDALKNEGAGEVVAARIGLSPIESREAA